jgi:hypothetical protein
VRSGYCSALYMAQRLEFMNYTDNGRTTKRSYFSSSLCPVADYH